MSKNNKVLANNFNKNSVNPGNQNINQNINQNHGSTSELDLNNENKISQKVECSGKVPSARFGHTLTMVSQSKIIMFGGAVGDTKNFVFSNETYALNITSNIWNRLESKPFLYF